MNLTIHTPTLQPPHTLLLSNSDGWFNIPLGNILVCSSCNSYTVVKLTGGQQIVVSQNMPYYEKALSPLGFARIHQSHLINLQHLTHLSKATGGVDATLSNGLILPVSRQFKTSLIETLKQRSVDALLRQGMQIPDTPKTQPDSN
ncbi:MAG: LytTR family DNA-binding domain-containing protein [Chitinophagales bacterium]